MPTKSPPKSPKGKSKKKKEKEKAKTPEKDNRSERAASTPRLMINNDSKEGTLDEVDDYLLQEVIH